MEPRVYVYKITFSGREEWYFGVHKEKKFDEYYMGSPVTHKSFWGEFEPQKEILEVFDYSEDGWHQALTREQELIRPDLNNPLCLNEACGIANSLASRSANMSKLNQMWWGDSDYREQMSKNTKEQWSDKNFRDKVSETISERNKKSWQEPEYREVNSKKSSQKMSSLWKNNREEMLEKVTKLNRERWQDPAFRETQTERLKNMMWITDGTKEGNRFIPKDSEIPKGFRKGLVSGLMWITDGTKEGNKMIDKSAEIPQGFSKGRTTR